ncbi:GAD-like domain-containing protein [Pseudoalteromonas sp. JC3]|uniref:GAD-like domain-containing protein n=2 Tax=Pseudoalteromonas sp. JC3 TaxID=2810196 RepID=UPI0025709E1A|nr:GAD-like domain-containing protein [Pseudoalteromonas sp. JC3]WJE11134.1 GAD-like domain-containing protein [Pseudoalteromonas sp. JC3]
MIETNDDDLAFFLSEFGQPTTIVPATTADIEAYRGKLPDQLLEYWQILGFSGFADGLFWLTNPADYQDILDRFLEDTPFEQHDIYYVIARNAWGKLQVYGEKTGVSLEISPHLNWMTTSVGSEQDIAAGKANQTAKDFIALQDPERLDIKDNQRKPLFPATLKKQGPLNADEVYGFAPFLFMGGEKKVKNIEKCDIFAYLNLIADMGDMEIIDMASMVRGAIKQHE